MQMTYQLSEIDSIAQQILKQSKNTIFLLYGDLGVGKTTLVKAMLQELDVTETISSPTFSIVNEYRNSEDEKIFHFDFYRLQEQEEALDIGLDDYLDQGDWIFMEWPEKIIDFLPKEAEVITIKATNEHERQYSISSKC